MINIEDSILINRPIEEVFAFVADQTNAPKWQDGLIEVRRLTDGPVGVGTKHAATRIFLGRKMELTNEYIKYEPNKQVIFKAEAGPMHSEVSYLTESTTNGTKLTCKMQVEQSGLFSLAEPLMAKGFKRDFAANFRTLKALLESQTLPVMV